MRSAVFVSEFTTNHMGNLNVLLRMVEQAAAVGCDYIKMQKKDVATFYTREKLAEPYLSPYGSTFRDYRTIFEFRREDYDRFDGLCRKLGIKWFSSVQDIPSLQFMLQYDVPMYKVASCKARDRVFLQEVAQCVPKSAAIVLSVGGSTLAEIEDSLNLFSDHHVHLLHCVSEYPCPPCSLRLGNIRVLKQRFESDRVTVGYSGHEEGFLPTLAALDLGATMIERHFCLSRHSFVHHIQCSLEPKEYQALIDIAKSEGRLDGLYASLPACAFETKFGMSDAEMSFLIDGKYGQ